MKIKKTVIVLGYECNNNCLFCCMEDRRKSVKNKNTKEIKKDILEAKKLSTTYLEFVGGEPTIRKDIFEIVKFANKVGFDTIMFATNGRMLSNKDFAKKLLDVGVNHVVFSVHGHNAELHDLLTKVPGSFEQLVKGINNLKDLGFTNIGTNTTIIKQNYKSLLDIAQLIFRLGITNSEFIFVDPTHGAPKTKFHEIVPSYEEVSPFVNSVLKFAKKNSITHWKVRYYPLCFIDEQFHNMVSEIQEVKNFHTEHIAPDFVNKDVEKSRESIGRVKIKKCEGCKFYNKCEGYWKEYAKNYEGFTSKTILLINPPTETPEFKEYIEENILYSKDYKLNLNNFPSSYQPIGLLKIARTLKKQGHKVKLIDCLADKAEGPNSSKRKTFSCYRGCGNKVNEDVELPIYLSGLPFDEFEEILKNEKYPDEIFVTSGLTYNWLPVHKIIEICKRIFPKSIVKLGGIYATLSYDHARKSKSDFVHKGVYFNSVHEWTDMGVLDYKSQHSIIKTTYGCPNKCTYCAVHVLEGNSMSYRAPIDVLNEIKDKIKKYDIKLVEFWESNILVNYKNYLEPLLDLIIKENLNIKIQFAEGFQTNLLTQELVEKLVKAGLKKPLLPLETSDDLYASKLNRPSSIVNFEKAVSYFEKAGINKKNIGCFILAGLPNQSFEDIASSIRYIWGLGCKPIIMPFAPVPESQMFKEQFHNKEVKLEELNPFLWPFASQDLSVKDLMMFLLSRKVDGPKDYAILLKKNRNFLIKIFGENKVKEYLEGVC